MSFGGLLTHAALGATAGGAASYADELREEARNRRRDRLLLEKRQYDESQHERYREERKEDDAELYAKRREDRLADQQSLYDRQDALYNQRRRDQRADLEERRQYQERMNDKAYARKRGLLQQAESSSYRADNPHYKENLNTLEKLHKSAVDMMQTATTPEEKAMFAKKADNYASQIQRMMYRGPSLGAIAGGVNEEDRAGFLSQAEASGRFPSEDLGWLKAQWGMDDRQMNAEENDRADTTNNEKRGLVGTVTEWLWEGLGGSTDRSKMESALANTPGQIDSRFEMADKDKPHERQRRVPSYAPKDKPEPIDYNSDSNRRGRALKQARDLRRLLNSSRYAELHKPQQERLKALYEQIISEWHLEQDI